jgi:hypothetical protein
VRELGHVTFGKGAPRFGMTPYLAGRRRILNLGGFEFLAPAAVVINDDLRNIARISCPKQ